MARRFQPPAGGSSGTAGTAFIVLKNLQNPRICHVRM
jgi:hypothetical protein